MNHSSTAPKTDRGLDTAYDLHPTDSAAAVDRIEHADSDQPLKEPRLALVVFVVEVLVQSHLLASDLWRPVSLDCPVELDPRHRLRIGSSMALEALEVVGRRVKDLVDTDGW